MAMPPEQRAVTPDRNGWKGLFLFDLEAMGHPLMY
jgi:hypothetical protein